jgi:RNA polymerase sigma factor (sigma-70 family)
MTMTADTKIRPSVPSICRRFTADTLAERVNAAVAGDQRAWNALIDQFGGLIWAVARAHRLYDADAADVVQATWLRAFEHLERLRDPARIGPWLATTARRECLRVLRVGGRTVPLMDDECEAESADAPLGEVVLLAERDHALRRAFLLLQASDQALLRMLMADPRPTYEEIAAALDIPIGSIGPTRQRALERLRRELAHQGSLNLMAA